MDTFEETPRTEGEAPRVATGARPLRTYVFSILFIIAVAAVTVWIVKTHKKPQAMTLIESQAMDMSTMAAPVGSVPVALETVAPGEFETAVSYSGTVVPYSEQEIIPRLEGIVSNMTVYPGDEVKHGQLLARLESPDVAQRSGAAASEAAAAKYSVSAAGAELEAAKASAASAANDVEKMGRMKDSAAAEIKSAQADALYRQQEYDRQEKLYNAGAISRSELEQERAMRDSALAMVDKTQSEFEAAEQTLGSARQQQTTMKSMADAAAMRRNADKSMSGAASQRAGAEQTVAGYLELRSPVDGVVTQRLVSPGTLGRAGSPILKIAELKWVRLQASVSLADTEGIAVGSAVEVTTPRAPGKKIETKITAVFPASDPALRTVTVEAVTENNDKIFKPGDYVTLRIVTGRKDLAVSVPDRALVRWGGGSEGNAAVWIGVPEGGTGKTFYTCVMHPQVHENQPGNCPICGMKLVPKQEGGKLKAHLVPITIGKTNGERTEVLVGLKQGDQVVTDGWTNLAEGNDLFPTEWGPAGPKNMPSPPDMGNMPGMNVGGSKDTKSMPGMTPEEMKNMPGTDMSKPAQQPKTQQKNDMQNMKDMGDMKGMEMGGSSSAKPKSAEECALPVAKKGNEANKLQPAGQSKVIYTCPMHPEVKSEKPGKCPDCGMDLVPMKK